MKTASDCIKAKKYFLNGKLAPAIEAFTMAVEKDPGSLDSFLGRGLAYLKLGRFDEAVQDFSEVLDGGGDCERAFFLRGIAYLNAKEYEHALTDLNLALEYNGKRGAAILARGLVLSSMGHHHDAMKDLTNPYVLENIIIDDFLEEYAISEELFAQAIHLFSTDTEEWKLLLTVDEVAKMETAHY